MGSALYLWLGEVEEALWRMIHGVFWFISDWLPTWIYRFVVETIWPVTIRLGRVSGLLCLWLFIVFGPLATRFLFRVPSWWMFGSAIWLGLAITGSVWGLTRLVKNRKAAVS